MTVLRYDGSFSGFLTCVFEVYERKLKDVHISSVASSSTLFTQEYNVETDKLKAGRLLDGMKKKISGQGMRSFYFTFLSELRDIENVLLEYVQYIFRSDLNIEKNYRNNSVLTIEKTAIKVGREKHRMEAFVRFRLTKDGLYYASVSPDFNVLPLIAPHFIKRYADQSWLIYDSKRKYGIHYDKDAGMVAEVEIGWKDVLSSEKENSDVYDSGEELYQLLWKDYFKSVNIEARRNMKLHIRHVPVRYWKYLTEKQ